MMGPWFGWGWGFGGWFMLVFMAVFWGLVIWGIVALVRRTGGNACCGPVYQQNDSALEILKTRYAKGEIGKEEFEEKKKALS
jgi:putative membrane protein